MKNFLQFYLLIMLLSSAMISCKRSNVKSESQMVTFDLKNLPQQTTLKLSDLGVVDIQYIPLETNEQSLIPNIRNIIRSKSYILIQYFSNINLFRLDGSFVTKIGVNGRGPNEFSVAHDIDINPKDESIYIVDGWQQKFLVYTRDGQIIRTFKSPQHGPLNFRFTKDGILGYYQNHMGAIENSFSLFDTIGMVIKEYPNKYPWTKSGPGAAFLGENLFYRFNDKLFKKEIYCDTIYGFQDQVFKPHMIVDVGNLRLTPTVRSESPAESVLNNYICPTNLFEFSDYIYYEFILYSKSKSGLISFIGSKKKDFKVLFDPEKDLFNDFDGGPNIWPRTIWDDKTLVSWIDALKLKKWVTSETFKNYDPKYPNKKRSLEELAAKLKETDNAVLILVKF